MSNLTLTPRQSKFVYASPGDPKQLLLRGDAVYRGTNDSVTASTGTLVTSGDIITAPAWLVSSGFTEVAVQESLQNADSALPESAWATRSSVARLLVFGHSYTEGTLGLTKQNLRFPTRLAALLGAREDNFGVSGTNAYIQANGMVNRVLQAVVPPSAAPYQASSQAAVLFIGINDLALRTIDLSSASIAASIRHSIRRLRAAGVYEAENAARWTFAQGGGASNWSTVAAGLGSGTSVKQAQANGNTWTLTTPADFPGGTLRICGLKGSGIGSTHAITLDGASHGTWDTRGGSINYDPNDYTLTGLTAGAHTIVGTISNIVAATDFIDYAQFEATDPGLVVVCNIPRSPAYSTGVHTVIDSDVDTANAAIAAVCAEFDVRVVLADISTLLGNKDVTLFAADGLHPNEIGHAKIAAYLADLVHAAYPGSLTLANQQMVHPDAFAALRLREPAIDPRSGLATLVAGTKVVTTRAITANSRVQLSIQALGTVAAPKALGVTARTAGTSFTITSADATDTSQVAWVIVEPEA